MKPNPRGAAAEIRACDFLVKKGLRLVCRNFHCRWGEIDLIMEDGPDLVFVEVRQRAGSGFGGALASVDARKQAKLRRAALAYLQQTGQTERPCRIDVVGLQDETEQPDWIRNAIGA